VTFEQTLMQLQWKSEKKKKKKKKKKKEFFLFYFFNVATAATDVRVVESRRPCVDPDPNRRESKWC
jgi:radical SAM superfamily enzyme